MGTGAMLSQMTVTHGCRGADTVKIYFLDVFLTLGRCRGAVSCIAPVALATMLIKLSVLM